MIAVEYLPYRTVHLAWNEGGTVWNTFTPCGLAIEGANLWQVPPTPGLSLSVCKTCLRAAKRSSVPREITKSTYFMPVPRVAPLLLWRVTFTGYAARQAPIAHTVEVEARDAGEARARARMRMDELFGRRMWRWEIAACEAQGG